MLCRRDKTKKSCQRLDLFKVAALSKKKLQTKIKRLNEKCKAEGTGKSKLKADLKQLKKDVAFWENMHAQAEEVVAGHTNCPHNTLFIS